MRDPTPASIEPGSYFHRVVKISRQMNSKNPKLAELRLKLRMAKSPIDSVPILHEIEKLGNEAAPLIPELIATMQRGVALVSSGLVPIIVQHKSQALLEAAIQQKETWSYLGIQGKADLFRAGFSRFQGELLDYLRESFDRDDDPHRLTVIEALAESGTASLVQELEDIEIWTARRLTEIEACHPSLSDEDEFMRPFLAASRRDFLEKLRAAIPRIRTRPDLEKTGSSEQTAKAEELAATESKPPTNLARRDAVADPDLNRGNFHPEVVRHSQKLFSSGNYFHAVFEAAKAYNKSVRARSKSTKDGADLMFEAFGLKGGQVEVNTCESDTDKNVQEGVMFLSVGLMRAIRNPTAHEPAADWPMTKQDALDILGLISFLYRQLDKAANR